VTGPNASLHTAEVRRLVRGMLEQAPSFGAMPKPEQQKLAHALVEVLSYASDPYASLAAAQGAPVAAALDDANSALKERLAKQQNLVGKDFKAGAAREGADVFKTLVAAVDFPQFVTSLVHGVYDSIVSASIRQMQAYSKLLDGVVKSVDEFAKENVSPQEARKFVASSFPGQIDIDQESGMLQMSGGEDGDGAPPDFKSVLQMQENMELNEENEAKIMQAAQLKMARQRQQQLATMVMMGINRIVVTEGEIKASVLFDVKAKDTGQRTTNASTADTVTQTDQQGGGWFSDPDTVKTSVSSAYSSEAEKSTAELDARAKLSGSVTVKFKSETFPLERLASSEEVGAVQHKSSR
jgi:hypothetical protein